MATKTFNYKVFDCENPVGKSLSSEKNYIKISLPYQESYYLINMDSLIGYAVDDVAVKFYFDGDSLGLFVLNDANVPLFENMLERKLRAYLPKEKCDEIILFRKLQ